VNLSKEYRTELESCNFIRTVLMLIVVLYHGILFWNGNWFTGNPVLQAEPLGHVAAWMNTFHVYGFTLVSGYVFYHVKCIAGRYADYRKFLVNKAQRLLVPFVTVSVLWVVPIHCMFMENSAVYLVKNFMLGCSPAQLWFMLMLFGVFAIMCPLTEFIRRHDAVGAMVVIGLYVVGMIAQRIIPNVFRIWTTCQYCLYFWMGMKLCQYTDNWFVVMIKKIPAFLWLAIHILLFVAFEYLSSKNATIIVLGLETVLKIYGAVMAFVVISRFAGSISRGSKIWSIMSKYSFSIYLFHQQIIYFVIYFLNGRVNPYLHAGLNIAMAFAGSMLISVILMKFRVTRVLIGEKG